MALWFVRGALRRVVTTKYPAVVDAWARELPTPPIFNELLLSAEVARRLVEVCPSRALRVEGPWLVYDIGACTACGACQRAAPEVARSSGVFELAADEPSQLVKLVAIRGGEA